MSDGLTFCEQLRILLDALPAEQVSSLRAVAHGAGISEQGLLKLMHGKTASPRLETARHLCHYFDIGLEYFDLMTERECQAYLTERFCRRSPVVAAIADEGARLDSRRRADVLTMLYWMRSAPLSRG